MTIAVVAERNARVSAPRDVSDDEEDGDGKKKGKGKERVPKKYVNLKLVALPPRNNSNMVSGDAYLQLLLFESDSIVHDGEKNTYRGGSGGAYEKWCNLSVGSVIAILNPRVLRPLKVSATRTILTPGWGHAASSQPPTGAQPDLSRFGQLYWASVGYWPVYGYAARRQPMQGLGRLA